MMIQDPQQIKYRAALQVERDYLAEDLELFVKELQNKFNLNRQNPISKEDSNILLDQIRSLANAHLELQFVDEWKKQSIEFKDQVVSGVVSKIIKDIMAFKSDEDLSSYGNVFVPILIEDTFVSAVKSKATTQ